MSRITLCAALIAAAAAAHAASAQGNPFQARFDALPTITVTYAYTGDMSGSARTTADNNRLASWSAVTGKFFGKTTNDTTWSLSTPDTLWNADLNKKTGTVSVNPLPAMHKAYDNLDGDSKARFHANVDAMAQFVAQALKGIPLGGQAKETRTIAGETCELTSLGVISYCTMKTAPIVLYTSGSILCVNYEETATTVTHTADPTLFQVPDHIKWSQLLDKARADSMAGAWVKYLASKELSDSIAKARQEYEKKSQQGSQVQSGHAPGDTAQQMSPEDQKKMCDALKNYSLSTALNDAWKSFLKESAQNAGRAAADRLFGHIIHP